MSLEVAGSMEHLEDNYVLEGCEVERGNGAWETSGLFAGTITVTEGDICQTIVQGTSTGILCPTHLLTVPQYPSGQ